MLLFSDQISGGEKSPEEANCLRGGAPAPLWKEAITTVLQCHILVMFLQSAKHDANGCPLVFIQWGCKRSPLWWPYGGQGVLFKNFQEIEICFHDEI